MADLQFPWEAFMQAQAAKNKNKQDVNQMFGQTLASLGQNTGSYLKKRNDDEQWKGAVTQLVQQNPELAPYAGIISKDKSLAGQVLPGLVKPKHQAPEYSVVPGMLSKTGHPFIQDKFSPTLTEMKEFAAVPTGGSAMAGVRKAQFTMQDLPSNQGPTTAAGAAYQVKVAARQGKNLIAKAGSSQRIGLASGDLARAVLRSAPTDEAMHNANFSDNSINRWNQLKQKITSDPKAINNPAIRKEMYSIFDEMDKSATPFIQNQLDDMEANGFDVSPATRKRQLGQTLPEIPFIEIPEAPPPGGKPNVAGGLTPEEQKELQILEAKYGNK